MVSQVSKLSNQEQALPPPVEEGALLIYRLYDVGYAIDLARAQLCLSEQPTSVRQPVRQAQAIQIPQPPLSLALDSAAVSLASLDWLGSYTMQLYDLGIVACCLRLPLPRGTGWETIADLLAAVQKLPTDLNAQMEQIRDQTLEKVRPAIERPNSVLPVEEYAMVVANCLAAGPPASFLADNRLLQQVLLGERRPLSSTASSLVTTLSYYEDDLILLSWNAALIIDRDPVARADAADLLEFANVQLLALRSYDAQLEGELSQVVSRLSTKRSGWRWLFNDPTGLLLTKIQSLIVEITETSGRVENAFKVTEDVYWNRLYSASLSVLRVDLWRVGINEKLTILSQIASILHEEVYANRTTWMEVAVIGLILLEVILAIFGRH